MFLSEGISRARQELWSGTTNTEQIHKKYKQTHVDDVDKNPFALEVQTVKVDHVDKNHYA